MIKVENLYFQYKKSDDYALKEIDLDIVQGDFLGVVGKSGAGKSTLTFALNGMIPHYFEGDFYGTVKIDGLDTVSVDLEDLSRVVGSIFQDIYGQMVMSIVEDEILFGLENFNFSREEITNRLEESLNLLGISNLRHRAISSLSGGQKQKVIICAILALKPKVLVLDEPTAELDPQSSRQVFEILKELNEKFKITIIVVEQKTDLICEFAKNLLILEKGKIVCHSDLKNVLLTNDIFEKVGIGTPPIVALASRLSELSIYSGEVPVTVDKAEELVRRIIS